MNNTNMLTNPKGIADCLEFFVLPVGEQGAAANAVRSAIAFLRALEPTADATLSMDSDDELVNDLVHAGNDDGHAGHLMMSDATRKVRDALLLRLTTWRAAMQEFVNGIERGEVQSRYTYGKFKSLLAIEQPPALTPKDAAEVERFKSFLKDANTMPPADLVQKHGDYMGLSDTEIAARAPSIANALEIDLDSDEPVMACGIGMAAGETCESCQ